MEIECVEDIEFVENSQDDKPVTPMVPSRSFEGVPDPCADTQRDMHETSDTDENEEPRRKPPAAANDLELTPNRSRHPASPPKTIQSFQNISTSPMAAPASTTNSANEFKLRRQDAFEESPRDRQPGLMSQSQSPIVDRIAVPLSLPRYVEGDAPTPNMQKTGVPTPFAPSPKKEGNQVAISSGNYQVSVKERMLILGAKGPDDVPKPIRNKMYVGLSRFIKSAEAGRRKLNPQVIARYYEDKSKGQLFSFLKEFVADTSCKQIAITKTHETKLSNCTEDKYEWLTRHELMLRHKGYQYDSGVKHVDALLKNACAKAMPGRPNEKALKLYRVYIAHTESKREEDTVIQTGSGKITATGAAAIEYVEGAVNNHNKRADIHEWYNGKGLTDDDAATDDDTAPPEQNLKQTKQNNKRKSPKPDDDAEQPQPKKQKTAEQEMSSHGPTRQ